MVPSIHQVSKDMTPAEVAHILRRDGAVIIENAISEVTLIGMNDELNKIIANTAPGLRHPTSDFFEEFYGKHTIRIDGIAAKSQTFLEVLQHPLMNGLAEELLLPNCEDYLLNTAQLIQIGPGETSQAIHRDEDAWSYFKNPKPLLEVEAMFALSDFTKENGATRVVPGSHVWDVKRQAISSEITCAEMKAGSALVYLGTTLHGGGANQTPDEWRRGMFFGFVLGWLRTEENMFLTVPMEIVKRMPKRCQELLGYKAHEGIGVVDVGSPMVLLSE